MDYNFVRLDPDQLFLSYESDSDPVFIGTGFFSATCGNASWEEDCMAMEELSLVLVDESENANKYDSSSSCHGCNKIKKNRTE